MTDWLGVGDCGDVTASLPRYANAGVVVNCASDQASDSDSQFRFNVRRQLYANSRRYGQKWR